MTDHPTLAHKTLHDRVQTVPPQHITRADQVMANTIDNGAAQIWLGIVTSMHPQVFRMELEQAVALRGMLDTAIAKAKAGVNWQLEITP